MGLFGKKNENDENKNMNPKDDAWNEIPENTEDKIVETTPMADGKPNPALGFSTPEGFEFNRYFLAERHIVLDNVSYETQRPVAGQLKLNVKDTIVAQVIGQAGVKFTFNRTLNFEPDGPFVLSVSFGVMLVFNPGTRGEVDWNHIDLANEFRRACPQLVDVMSSKAALLIGEITAMGGGNPIIIKR